MAQASTAGRRRYFQRRDAVATSNGGDAVVTTAIYEEKEDNIMDQSFPIGDGDQRRDSESHDPAHNSTPIYFPGKELYQNENLLIYPGNNLPHWEMKMIAYHVSFRLDDAIPTSVRMQWQEERKRVLEIYPNGDQVPTKEEMKRFQYLYSLVSQ